MLGFPVWRKFSDSVTCAKRVYYTYNITRMPKTVEVPAVNGTITYNYSAAGEKLSVNYKWHSGLSLNPLENTGKNYTDTDSILLQKN